MATETAGNMVKVLEEAARKSTMRYEESVVALFTSFDQYFSRKAVRKSLKAAIKENTSSFNTITQQSGYYGN